MVTTIVCCSRAWRVNVCDADSLVISRRGGDEVDRVGGEHQVPKPSSLLLLSPLTNHHNEPSSSSIHRQKQIFRHFTVRTKTKTKKNHSQTLNHTVLAIPSPLLNLSFAFLIIGQLDNIYFCSLPSGFCVHTHIYIKLVRFSIMWGKLVSRRLPRWTTRVRNVPRVRAWDLRHSSPGSCPL